MCLTAHIRSSPARSLRARRSQLRASPRDPFLRKNAIHVLVSEHSEDPRLPRTGYSRCLFSVG